jgi:hypothetical protein
VPRLAKSVALVAVYVGVACVWIYVLEGPLWTLAFLLFNVIVGFVAGTWWALLLPLTLGPLAIWAPSSGDVGAGWAFAAFFDGPIVAIAIAIGVGAAVLARRRST